MGVDAGYYRAYLLVHLSFIAPSGLSLMKHHWHEKIPVALQPAL
jgi:hypothetical protein